MTITYTYNDDNLLTKVSSSNGTSSGIPTDAQEISYTSFGRPNCIREKGNFLIYTYNSNYEKAKIESTVDNNTVTKLSYANGKYRRIRRGNEIIQRLYLGGDAYTAFAVLERKDKNNRIYYLHRDYLGSITGITDSEGNLQEEYSYTAWGRLRHPKSWEVYAVGNEPMPMFGRGYTGHEHLSAFGLINMNARLYDAGLGRFLSPDPFVQSPDFSQNFNRYSYALNNPLIYTDPDGEFWWAVAAAWLLFTESGYEVQKYVSPVAVHVDVKLGTHQTGLGFDVSVGVPKAMPVSYRYNYGKTYYWETYGDHSGWETRKGGEWTLFGLVNYSGTTFSGVGYPREQTTNMITLGGPFVNLKYENDTYLGNFKLPGVPQGDPYSDVYRTAGARIKVGSLKMGMILHTGEGTGDNWVDTNGDGIPDTRAFTGGDVGDPSQSHGIFYVGFGPFRMGRDTENIRQTFQNDFAHDGFNGGNRGSAYPSILTLDRDPRWFFQFGWGNGSTLY